MSYVYGRAHQCVTLLVVLEQHIWDSLSCNKEMVANHLGIEYVHGAGYTWLRVLLFWPRTPSATQHTFNHALSCHPYCTSAHAAFIRSRFRSDTERRGARRHKAALTATTLAVRQLLLKVVPFFFPNNAGPYQAKTSQP